MHSDRGGPYRECKAVHCTELVSVHSDRPYCSEHWHLSKKGWTDIKRQRRETEAGAGHKKRVGYGSKWAGASKRYRGRFPLCALCLEEGITTKATQVHHTVPHRGDWTIFWDSSKWQSLCTSHHSIETNKEIQARKKPKMNANRKPRTIAH